MLCNGKFFTPATFNFSIQRAPYTMNSKRRKEIAIWADKTHTAQQGRYPPPPPGSPPESESERKEVLVYGQDPEPVLVPLPRAPLRRIRRVPVPPLLPLPELGCMSTPAPTPVPVPPRPPRFLRPPPPSPSSPTLAPILAPAFVPDAAPAPLQVYGLAPPHIFPARSPTGTISPVPSRGSTPPLEYLPTRTRRGTPCPREEALPPPARPLSRFEPEIQAHALRAVALQPVHTSCSAGCGRPRAMWQLRWRPSLGVGRRLRGFRLYRPSKMPALSGTEKCRTRMSLRRRKRCWTTPMLRSSWECAFPSRGAAYLTLCAMASTVARIVEVRVAPSQQRLQLTLTTDICSMNLQPDGSYRCSFCYKKWKP